MKYDKIFDEKIKSALAFDEKMVDINYEPLKAAKNRLKSTNNIMFRGKLKVSIIFALVFIMVCGFLGVNALQRMRTDKIDYPFVNDAAVIGKWESVDFVVSMDDFVPDRRQTSLEGLYLKELAFAKDGRLLSALSEGNGVLAETKGIVWTKGFIIDQRDKTAGEYEIREIDGNTYMFMQWKNGDYVYRGMDPRYYVLKKVDDSDYSGYECNVRVTDNTDYPFVDDPGVLGKWQCVDYVTKIDSFDPHNKFWGPDVFFVTLDFIEGGKLTMTIAQDGSEKTLSWTKGLILDEIYKTASEYLIKEIDGTTYMFYGLKGYDYKVRGVAPYYLVFKRSE